MKKLLNISVIAALAVLPFAANAEVGDIVSVNDPANIADVDPTQQASAVTAQTDPKYALATSGANDGNVATAGYVKGAYNAAIKAINKVSETANSAVKGVQVNGADLSLTNGKANVTITSGNGNGTIRVNNQDVAVTGLGSAAYTDSTAYISSTAGSVKTANIDNGQVTKEKLASGVQSSLDKADAADTLLGNAAMGTQAGTVTGAIAELNDAIGDIDDTYATQTGAAATATTALKRATVTSTFSNGAIANGATATGTVNSTVTGSGTATVAMPTSGTVDTLTTWGNDDSTGTAGVTLATTSTTINSTVTGSATAENVSLAVAGSVTGDVATTIAPDITVGYTTAMPQQ